MEELKQKLNNLAQAAKSGCKNSEEYIYKKYIPVIYRLSKGIRHLIDDEVAFEAECVKRLMKAIREFDPKLGQFSEMVDFRLRQARSHFLVRRRKKNRITTSYDYLTQESDSKTERKFRIELIDDLAVIDDNILVKEKIALLAKDDPKKKVILVAWSDGYTSDSEISQLLAQLFGGNPESHRKAIMRFRAFCQANLPQIA